MKKKIIIDEVVNCKMGWMHYFDSSLSGKLVCFWKHEIKFLDIYSFP